MKVGGGALGADTETTAGYVRLLALGDGHYLDSVTSPLAITVPVRVRAEDNRILNPKEPTHKCSRDAELHPEWGCPSVPQADRPLKVIPSDPALEFLYRAAENVAWVVFWNLGFDFAATMKPWIEEHWEAYRKTHYDNIKRRRRLNELSIQEQLRQLTPAELEERQTIEAAVDGEDNIERFDTDRYHVRLIGNKAFSLSHKTSTGKRDYRKRREWFFDAAAWYSTSFGGVSLDFAAKKYLGRGKTNEDLAISRERIGDTYGYYEEHREAIVQYCIEDCKLTAELMALTVRAFEDLGYPFPDKPFSRASVSREYLKQNGPLNATAARYQRLKNNADHSLFEKSFRGGVFLLVGAGRWDDPYSLDINSAYPDAMCDFPSLEGASVLDAEDPRFRECYFTFHQIRVRPTPRTPTRAAGETRKIYGWSDEPVLLCVTGIDLAVLREMGEEFEVVSECGIYCPHANDHPLDYLRTAFDRKADIKKKYGSESVQYWNLKILLNGTYGLLAQRKPRESQWTNLIYASYVTAWCRQKLWRAVRETEERGDYVVSLATDGLLAVSPSGSNAGRDYWREQDSPALGEWSFTPHKTAICFESGVGFLSDDGSTWKEVKKRGMPKLTPEALLACSEVEWAEISQRPLKLRSALIQKRTAQLGVFEEHERNLCPVKSYRDAGMAFPKDLARAPLSSFFERHWPLLVRGQRDPARLTPPADATERRKWDAVLKRRTPLGGYIYPPSPSRRDAKRGKKPASDPTGPPVDKKPVVPSESGGSAKDEKPSTEEPLPPSGASNLREDEILTPSKEPKNELSKRDRNP